LTTNEIAEELTRLEPLVAGLAKKVDRATARGVGEALLELRKSAGADEQISKLIDSLFASALACSKAASASRPGMAASHATALARLLASTLEVVRGQARSTQTSPPAADVVAAWPSRFDGQVLVVKG